AGRKERVRRIPRRLLDAAAAHGSRRRAPRASPVTRTAPRAGAHPRVVVLTPYFRPLMGGVESNAERLALFLRTAGFEVTVLTKRLTKDLPDADATDHVRIERVGPFGPRSASGKWRMLPAVTSWLVRHRDRYDVVCS